MISREDLVAQSVTDFARAGLLARGYPPTAVAWVEAFNGAIELPDGQSHLDRTTIAVGYGFDQGAEQAEIGSSLRTRLYTFEFFVLGKEQPWGRNVSSTLKLLLDCDTIPLLDYRDPAQPEIDRLIVEATTSEREAVPDPEPWQEDLWLAQVKVTDEYYADLW